MIVQNVKLLWRIGLTACYNRCLIAAVFLSAAVALCALYTFKSGARSTSLLQALEPMNHLTSPAVYSASSSTPKSRESKQPIQLKAEEGDMPPSLSFTDHAHKLAADYSLNTAESGVLKMTRILELGWSGFNVTCFDTVPSIDELRDSATRSDHVEITYATCCSFGGGDDFALPSSCRTSAKALVIPRSNAEAMYAAGQRTTDLSAIDTWQAFVFVTGASENHYRESLELVRIIQQRFPNRTLVYWDIGLTAEQVEEVKIFCNVVYMRLDFTKYPAHVRKLSTYAFKPLVIMESLAEYPVIWWVDTSIRFTGDDLSPGLKMLNPRHGLVMFHDPGHSVWSTTYRQTYEYIATDEPGLQRTVTCTGASFIVANTPEIFSTFLYWLYACALDSRCIAPVDHPEYCNQQGPTVFAGCHRFDQSVMTILAANFWGFGSDSYRFQHDYFHLERWSGGRDDVSRCRTA